MVQQLKSGFELRSLSILRHFNVGERQKLIVTLHPLHTNESRSRIVVSFVQQQVGVIKIYHLIKSSFCLHKRVYDIVLIQMFLTRNRFR